MALDDFSAATKLQAAERGRRDRKFFRDRKHIALKTAGLIAKPPPWKRPEPLPRRLMVKLVEVNRLSDIDIIGQRFRAEIVVQLAFIGGALDEHLSKPSAEFPLDGFGRPTFRPSAAWYMAQVDFNNAHEYKTLDAKTVVSGDDILLNYRFEGQFSEVMELENFPCDVQDLTASLAFNTRTTGMMPLEVACASDMSTGIVTDGFVDGRLWDLHEELDVRPGTTGRTPDRLFPSVEMIILVGRQPKFVLLNVALPVFFFVPMSMLQFSVPRHDTADRLSVSLAMMLTAVAHKYSMMSMVPQLSYMTFIDKYVLSSTLLIVFITFQGATIGLAEVVYCRLNAFVVDLDAEDSYADDAARHLVVSSRSGYTGAAGSRYIEYSDSDCPPSTFGPWNKFDWIDLSFLCLDLVLWLLIQAWAYNRYWHVKNGFEKRVKAIEDRRKAQRAAAVRDKMRRGFAVASTSFRLKRSMTAKMPIEQGEASFAKQSSAKAASKSMCETEDFGASRPAPMKRLKTYGHLPDSGRKSEASYTLESASRESSVNFAPSPPGAGDSVLTRVGLTSDGQSESALRPLAPTAPVDAPTAPLTKSPRNGGRSTTYLAPLPTTSSDGAKVPKRLAPCNLQGSSRWQMAASASTPSLPNRSATMGDRIRIAARGAAEQRVAPQPPEHG